jgi:Pathogenicity locus
MKSDLLDIPGIGKNFVKDFARIDIFQIKDLRTKNPEKLFRKLEDVNIKLGHKTSKNYLYVIRMAVYYANGGRNVSKLKWSSWKDV